MKNIMNKLHKAFDFVGKGNLKQAEILYLECLDKIDDRKSKLYKQAMHGLAFIKNELNYFKEANELYTELLRMAREEENKQEEAIAYHQLGMVERKLGNYEKALHLFSAEQEIYNSFFPNFHLGFAANLYESGTIHLLQKKLKEAQRLMEESLNHAEQTDDLIVVGCAYRGLGDIFEQSGEKDKVRIHYQYALDAFQKANDSQGVKEVEKKMANL